MTTTPDQQRRIEYVPLDEITPATRNPKAHDIDVIVGSIKQFGFTTPALLDERTDSLVVGHGRVEALSILRDRNAALPDGVEIGEDGVTWMVPVIRGWRSKNDAHAEAYLIADNRSSELGGWDSRLLTELLEDIAADSTGLLTATGYTADDLDDMLMALGDNTMSLDDLAEQVGDPNDDDTWVNITIRVPPQVKAAFDSHTDTCSGDKAAALAELLEVEMP